jgi:hypothetical protein
MFEQVRTVELRQLEYQRATDERFVPSPLLPSVIVTVNLPRFY